MQTIAVLLVMVSIVAAEWVDFGISDLDHVSLKVVKCTLSGFVVEIILSGFQSNSFSENGSICIVEYP